VRSGETLGIIAARYRTTVAELMRMNRLKSAHRLSIGQRLQVPDRTGGAARSSKPKAEPVGAGNVYVVQSGDTLGSIAEREKIPLDRLLAANDLSPRAMILPGQRIRIPS
jgi:membrane-bound lytic murein transglycosylase D